MADLITGGTASADTEYSVDYSVDKACDDNDSTRWASTDTAHPHWWKYDYGVGGSATVNSIAFKTAEIISGEYNIKDFVFQGSSNDTDWTTLYTGQHANNGDLQTFNFSNSTAYRYYRIYISNNWASGYANWASITEISFYYTETGHPTIKRLGGVPYAALNRGVF